MSQTAERQAWTDFVERGADAQRAADTRSKPTAISFIVDCRAVPQGSMGGVCTTRADGSPVTILKADNPRTHGYRKQVGFAALQARAAAGIHGVLFAAEQPVRVAMTFVFKKPKSAPTSRTRPITKPDYDKLARSTTDALTGILWADDCQVVDAEQHKIYGDTDCVHVRVELVEES